LPGFTASTCRSARGSAVGRRISSTPCSNAKVLAPALCHRRQLSPSAQAHKNSPGADSDSLGQ
jgi:hypothetical protein